MASVILFSLSCNCAPALPEIIVHRLCLPPFISLFSRCGLQLLSDCGQALPDAMGDVEETRKDEARNANKNAIVSGADRAHANTGRHIESNAAARARPAQV